MQTVTTTNLDRAVLKPTAMDIVIVGAGYAGMTLALTLSKYLAHEFTITVIDHADPLLQATPAKDSRSSALSAGTVNLLKMIGVWPEIEPHAQPVTTIKITDGKLESPMRHVFVHYDNVLDDGSPATHIVENQFLHRALAVNLAANAGIALIPSTTITTVSTETGRLELSDGRSVSTRLIVAADGRNSSLRDMVGIKTVKLPHNQTGIVATVAHERPHDGCAVQHFLPSGPFAILPLPGNRSSIVWSEERNIARDIMALDDAGFLTELEKRFRYHLGDLTLDGPRGSWPLETQLARSMVARRTALIGDAAHGVHPIAGQGFNLAARDIAALSETLVEAQRLGIDFAQADVLERYERWRRFDSTLSAFTFDGLNRLFSNDNAFIRTARDFGLNVVDRLDGLKSALVKEAAGLNGETPKLLRSEPL